MVILVAFSFMVEHLSKSDFLWGFIVVTVFISAHPLTTLELNLLVYCLSVCPHYIRSVCACVGSLWWWWSQWLRLLVPPPLAQVTFFSCCLSAMCLCAGVSHRCAEAESGVTGGEECLCVFVCVCVLTGSVWHCELEPVCPPVFRYWSSWAPLPCSVSGSPRRCSQLSSAPASPGPTSAPTSRDSWNLQQVDPADTCSLFWSSSLRSTVSLLLWLSFLALVLLIIMIIIILLYLPVRLQSDFMCCCCCWFNTPESCMWTLTSLKHTVARGSTVCVCVCVILLGQRFVPPRGQTSPRRTTDSVKKKRSVLFYGEKLKETCLFLVCWWTVVQVVLLSLSFSFLDWRLASLDWDLLPIEHSFLSVNVEWVGISVEL